MKKETAPIILILTLVTVIVSLTIASQILNSDYYANCCNCNNPPFDFGIYTIPILIITILLIMYISYDSMQGKVELR